MSEHPHIRAYLCDECWNSIPHFVVKAPQVKRRKIQKNEWSWKEIALYTLGRVKSLEKMSHPVRNFVVCEQCKNRIKEKE